MNAIRGGGEGGSCGIRGKCTTGPTIVSKFPVRYSTGEIGLQATDLYTAGFGRPWGHTRSFSSRLSRNDNIGNGFNWQVKEWPFLSVTDDQTQIIVMGELFGSLWFNKVGDTYEAAFPLIKQALSRDDNTNRYYLTGRDGSVTEFDILTGMFRRHADPDGNVIEVTGMNEFGLNFTQVERTYISGGETITEQFQYDYNNDFGDTLLERVTLRRKVDNGIWTDIQRAEYDYYGQNEDYGSLADLKTVHTLTWDGSDWADTGTTYYRYWTSPAGSSSSSSSSTSSDSSSSSSSSSFPVNDPRIHLIRFVLNPSNFARMIADSLDPLTANDVTLSLYVDNYFEYDEFRRVTREMVQGGSQVFLYGYEQSSFSDGYNSWKTKTTETLPDSSQKIIYSNFAAQPMVSVLKSGSDEWIDFFQYDDNGNQILQANPSAVVGYDDTHADLLHFDSGRYEFLRDHAGLISTYTVHAPSGFVASSRIQRGQCGCPIKLREFEYCCAGEDCDCGGGSSSSSSSCSSSSACASGVWFLKREIVYPDDGCGCDCNSSSSSSSSCASGDCCSNDGTRQIITSYDYTFYSGTTQVQQKTTTLPAIPVEQNGSGIAATRKEYFDSYGNLIWTMDERGFITGMTYDIPTGALTQRIDDVDTGLVDAPAGWTTPSGGGLHLITDYEHDDQGRMTQSLGPTHTIDLNGTATVIRRASWIVYQDADFQTWSAQGFATGDAPDYEYTLVNPVSITQRDASGKVLEQISAVRESTSGKLESTDSFPQSSYVRWTTRQYTDCCFAASVRVYHTIPSSGEGDPGTNYDETDYGYDVMKRQNRTVTPGGTITYNVFDVRGQIIKSYIGTNDTGATDEDPTGGGASGNNMVLVTEQTYDDGADGGDGNLTLLSQYVDATTARHSVYLYDWRNRRTIGDGEIDFYQTVCYDNLDRIVRSDRQDTNAEGQLIERSEISYDDHNHIFKQIRYGVDPVTGSIENSLTDNFWYDASGHMIKRLPSGSQLFTKTIFDSLGRATCFYIGYDLDETSYDDAGDVSDDVILEQIESSFDFASNIIETRLRQRYHDAPDSQAGPLQDPSIAPKARVTYSAIWPDPIGRNQSSANYGTNGGTVLSRPNTIPARSDDVLVNSSIFDSAGNHITTVDPSGMTNCFEYDDAGRQTSQIRNFIEIGSSSSSSSSSSGDDCDPSADRNVTTLIGYNADGNVVTITAINLSTGNQTTEYLFGTTLADSAIATTTLLSGLIPPDSVDEDDLIVFAYNRQRQVVQMTDQAGTVHAYDFDLLGRLTADRVTTVGADTDDSVLRIEAAYELRGLVERVTSYNSASVGTGAIVNDCLFVYNDFRQLVGEYQSHDGLVDTNSTPRVTYSFADGLNNTIRPTSLTYPDGRVLTYNYGEVNGKDDASGRIAAFIDDDGSTHLTEYQYLGGQSVVVTDYTQPETKYTLVGTAGGNDPDSGDIYRGLDRFGRIKDSYWFDYGDGADIDRLKYGFDRVSNRTYSENTVANTAGQHFDELYVYDLIHRLEHMDRGTLNLTKTVITSPTFQQCWTLDETGNWRGFRSDNTGDGLWDLVQMRISNSVNETTNLQTTFGPAWTTPAYSREGNMITLPQPHSPTSAFTAVYDAWQRLVRLIDPTTTDFISEYKYDGANRRIIQETYLSGMLSETRHFYYTMPSVWQVVEERLGTSPASASPDCQYVWGVRYVDDCVLRDRDTDDDGLLDERLYALQDAHWNVNGLVDVSGVVQERFAYTPYGTSLVLAENWMPQDDMFAWETRYTGYRLEAATGLLHVRNRAMLTEMGGWLQRDPLGQSAGINLYEYARSTPTTYADPAGTIIAELVTGAWLILSPLAPAAPILAPNPIVLLVPATVAITNPAIIATPIIIAAPGAGAVTGAGATTIGLVPGLGIAVVGGVTVGLGIDQFTNPILSPHYANFFDWWYYDSSWDAPIIGGIGLVGGVGGDSDCDKNRKRCTDICTDYVGRCYGTSVNDIRDDEGHSRCDSCLDKCQGNCRRNPENVDPWPDSVTLIRRGKPYEGSCYFK